MFLIVYYLIASALAAACKTDGNNCVAEQCEMVGETEICKQCAKTYIPINGKCVTAANNDKCKAANGSDNADQTCKKCLLETFMYKGGCYQTTQQPGQTMCKIAANGKCTEAVTTKEYFVPTDADASHDSVVSCGDTAGVTIGENPDSKTYKGVDGCKTCTISSSATTATCTECATGFLHTSSGSTSCVETCPKGYFGHTATGGLKTCQPCATANSLSPSVTGIPGCASCTYTGGDSGTLTCSECNEGKKPSLDGKSCNSCTDTNCAFCASGNVCQKCDSGYILDGAACTQQTCSTPDCKTCTNPKASNEACTACVSNYYLTPTGQCVDSCGKLGSYYGATENEKKVCKRCGVANCEACNAQGQCQTCSNGFYKDNTGACQKCDSSCKSCGGATNADCTECPAGKALIYGSDGTKGTCGEGCSPATGTEAGSCKTCDLTVGGTKYCSACNVATEYPQNGVCTSKTARTADGCKDGTVTGGVCKSCSNGFFLMDGGCYETSRYPGKSVCTSAPTGGTCTSLASGYYLNGGTLVTCSEGCKTCSDAKTCTDCVDGYVLVGNACTKCDASCLTCETSANTCKACASGYYLSGSTCTSCESNSGDIKGVKGCLNCAAPSSNTGAVLCYLVKDSTAGNSDPNLSSGAIAGISVAVIAVVGGLVGFLCWWFICRRKV